MASPVSSSSPLFSLLSFHNNNSKNFEISLKFSHSPKPNPSFRRPFFVSFARRTETSDESDISESKKQMLIERFGIDPEELLSESSRHDKSRRRKGMKNNWRVNVETPLPLIEEPTPPRTTHRLLKVIGGKVRRRKLLSPKGLDVRPMMEVVRGATFDILQVAGGCPASLRPGRWLDLYSGTGSVGIEAISRGCTEAHFVEMDPWVVSQVLKPNLEWTGFLDVSDIHIVRVENFLANAKQFLGQDGPFDYISVTPPYTAVDYAVLMGQLAKSNLIGDDTFIVVEYPLETPLLESCGDLKKITDRRFGRTILAIYGPAWSQKKRK